MSFHNFRPMCFLIPTKNSHLHSLSETVCFGILFQDEIDLKVICVCRFQFISTFN